MKKLIVSLAVFAMATLGLVGTSSFQAANAATCPYSGCVKTTTTLAAPAKLKSGSYASFLINVAPKSGTGHPKGTVTLTCTGPGKKHQKTRKYRGQARSITMHFKARGTWSCTVKFHSASKWRSSSDSASFKVVKRHKKH